MNRIMRAREVGDVTGLSRTTIWNLERAGKFPRRVKLTTRAVGWLEDQVLSWVKGRAAGQEPARRQRATSVLPIAGAGAE